MPKDMKRKIRKISVVCQTGAETYCVGQKGIAKIELSNVSYKGDQLEMYVCYSSDGWVFAEISPLAPIVIEYERVKK